MRGGHQTRLFQSDADFLAKLARGGDQGSSPGFTPPPGGIQLAEP
jgi:hypothetical protein